MNLTIDLQKKIAFPDHYELRKSEIKNIIKEAAEKKLVILTTEKDFYRLKKYDFKEIRYIKIRLKITDEKKFLEKINNSLC